jgi:hypothetical protein
MNKLTSWTFIIGIAFWGYTMACIYIADPAPHKELLMIHVSIAHALLTGLLVIFLRNSPISITISMSEQPIVKYLGHYSIREIKPYETYFCEKGCGECEKIIIEEDNLVRTTQNIEGKDIIVERHFSKADVSSCCSANLGIWDTEDDKDMNADYVFNPAN